MAIVIGRLPRQEVESRAKTGLVDQLSPLPPTNFYWVVLDGSLAAATDFETGASTATASVYINSGTPGSNLVDAGWNLTVVNRDEDNTYASGHPGIATWVSGEWAFHPMKCP